MAVGRRDRESERIIAGIKGVFALLFLMALAIGGLQGFASALKALMVVLFLLIIMVLAIWGIVFVAKRTDWSRTREVSARPVSTQSDILKPSYSGEEQWTCAKVLSRMEKIDWYQFEKLCAAILKAEGYSVERKGGAQPDGGVDLVASKYDGNDILIQCKHWNTWKVGEPVVRQLLGSMTDFNVRQAAIYTMKGWTAPALEFARKHQIQLVSGEDLARRAHQALAAKQLDIVLDDSVHHCPKCESPMVLRTGDFKPFWGCSRYPKCKATIKVTN